jgi:hypothetical protein
MIKNIILFIIFIFFFIFSDITFAKVEKTNIGFSIDVPSDLILVERKNYEEVKKVVNYIPESKKRLLSEAEIKSIENDNEKVEKYFRRYEIGGYIMFGLIPKPPMNYNLHNIAFSKLEKIDFSKAINDKKFLATICSEILKSVQGQASSMKNIKIDSCKIDKDKFKNFNQTIKINYDMSKITDKFYYEGYLFNFNNYLISVELISEKQNYHILDRQLLSLVNSIK